MPESWESLSFLDHYLEHNKRYESPTSFWKWSAIGTVAGTLRESVYRRTGDNKLFPNVYILFLAESGFHRKGRPPEFSEGLVRSTKAVKVISGRASIQAIVQELARTETDPKTGKLIKGGSAIFFAPEMAAGIVSDPAAIGILTDLFEPKEIYDTLLKTQARSSISNLVFSMVAASNEELLKKVYDSSALRGGLLARTFLVVPDEFREPNSLMDISDDEYILIDKSKKCLQEKLLKISQLKGEMKMCKQAQGVYDDWYKPFRKNHEHNRDKTGMLGRVHTGIVKLSMILAANDLDMIILPKHVETAIEMATGLIPNYNRLVMSGTMGTEKETGGMIINDLLDNKDGRMSRKALFQRHILDFSAQVFDAAILTLETAGLITQEYDSRQEQWFVLTPKAREYFKR